MELCKQDCIWLLSQFDEKQIPMQLNNDARAGIFLNVQQWGERISCHIKFVHYFHVVSIIHILVLLSLVSV